MLPAHIIEELLRRRRELERSNELVVELPAEEPPPRDDRGGPGGDGSQDQGVAIVDFTV
jgi:hypothetical protein